MLRNHVGNLSLVGNSENAELVHPGFNLQKKKNLFILDFCGIIVIFSKISLFQFIWGYGKSWVKIVKEVGCYCLAFYCGSWLGFVLLCFGAYFCYTFGSCVKAMELDRFFSKCILKNIGQTIFIYTTLKCILSCTAPPQVLRLDQP